MNEEELFCKLFPDYTVNRKPLSPYFDLFESGFEQAENCIEQLEKENAELKSENQKWKDEWQEQVQKATDEGYARTLQTIQLSKTKELIKNLMVYVPVDLKEYEEAKQFLNSEGK